MERMSCHMPYKTGIQDLEFGSLIHCHGYPKKNIQTKYFLFKSLLCSAVSGFIQGISDDATPFTHSHIYSNY